jgi:hypothetical protein
VSSGLAEAADLAVTAAPRDVSASLEDARIRACRLNAETGREEIGRTGPSGRFLVAGRAPRSAALPSAGRRRFLCIIPPGIAGLDRPPPALAVAHAAERP